MSGGNDASHGLAQDVFGERRPGTVPPVKVGGKPIQYELWMLPNHGRSGVEDLPSGAIKVR